MSSFASANRVLVFFVGLWVSFSLGLLVISCADEQGTAAPSLAAGEQALARAEIGQAAQDYRTAVSLAPDDAEAAFGHALTRLLLLSDSEPVRAIAAATGGKDVALEPALYGPQGALARLAAGATTADVLQQLVAASPWGRERLDNPAAFLRGLPQGISVDDLGLALRGLATELYGIASWFEGASARPSLCFRVPGSALHLGRDLQLGAADARLLAGLLRLGQGLALAGAGLVADEQPLELAGATSAELAQALNDRFSRSRPLAGRLEEARFALDLGLRTLESALALGVLQGSRGCGGEAVAAGRAVPLARWELVGAADAAALTWLLEAVRQALYAPALLPDSTPATWLGLARAFDEPYWPASGLDRPFQVDAQDRLVLARGFLGAFAQPLSSPPVQPAAAADQGWSWPTLFGSGVPAEGFLGRWTAPLRDQLKQDLGI